MSVAAWASCIAMCGSSSKPPILGSIALGLVVCPLFAASPNSGIVVTLNGTLGYFSGTDCLSEANTTVTLTATFDTAAAPTHISTGGTLVTYKLPAGAVSGVFSGGGIRDFTSKGKWTAKFGTKGQTMELDGLGPGTVRIYTHTKLQKGSWSNAILQHPVAFSPSPQNALAPLSGWNYHAAPGCQATFSFTGTASN